jgi:hypothetical protein
MSAEYSIWLMPSAADLAELQALVNEVAPQFGEPAFVPHVTVQGDLALPLASVTEHVRSSAAACAPQRWQVLDVERSDFFYRCLYLRFEQGDAFDSLQRAAEAFSKTADGLSPYPHLSLAYGRVAPHQLALFEALRTRFNGRTITFDRLAVCLSSKDTPIADWKCVADAPLTG